jgi:hypothetical protein
MGVMLLIALPFAARADAPSVLDAALDLAKSDLPYGNGAGKLVCNQFISKVLQKSGDRTGGDLGIDGLITFFSSAAGWSWSPRSADASVLQQVSALRPGDVVFMVHDGDKTACDKKTDIPAELHGGEEHHVGVVVRVEADGSVQLAEAGSKSRKCLKTVSGRADGGTRVERYAASFVANTLFGYARKK